eukprot:Lankesteria_metandrocarpae@DN5353_c1_g1_i8.p2
MTAIRSGSVWLAVVVVLLLHQHQPATAAGDDSDFVHHPRNVVSETLNDNGTVMKNIEIKSKTPITFGIRQGYNYDIKGPTGYYLKVIEGNSMYETSNNCNFMAAGGVALYTVQ